MKKTVLFSIITVCFFTNVVSAEILWSGDVIPSDPSNWDSSTDAYIGNAGVGTMDITSGSAVINHVGNIGYGYGSTGAVTVDGSGSTWTNSHSLNVGRSGDGTLNITDGGVVNSNVTSIGFSTTSTGEVNVDGSGSIWISDSNPIIGRAGNGTLNITNGGEVRLGWIGFTGYYSGSTGEINVDGSGSTWTSSYGLYVGYRGDGTLNITGGGEVSGSWGIIGDDSTSTGAVTVDGAGSTWINDKYLYVGRSGDGTLNITGGGLVSVAETLTIDYNGGDDSFINMATGGMLALFGNADESLVEFLGLVGGSDAIRYWDDSVMDWADITGATYGTDYTLEYLTEGDLAGYTMLTVPEPATVIYIDIGPQFCPNPLNVKSKGVLSVAILGTEIFDVSIIDPISIRLNGVAPIRSSLEDVTAPLIDPDDCECTTAGPDGLIDLTFKFKTQEIVESIGEVERDDILPLPLTGVLHDGTPVEGADCIVIKGRHKPINVADVNKDGVVNVLDMTIFAQNWLESSIVE